MSNSIYIKFEWASIAREEKWLIENQHLKNQILQDIYDVAGWDIVVAQQSNQVAMTIIDNETIYYTFYGVYNVEDEQFIVSKINYIYLPRVSSYDTLRVNFVASPCAQSASTYEKLIASNHTVVNLQMVCKQLYSTVKAKLKAQLNGLHIEAITKNKLGNIVIQLSDGPIEHINTMNDSYTVYSYRSSAEMTLESVWEHAIEIGKIVAVDAVKHVVAVKVKETDFKLNRKYFMSYPIMIVSDSIRNQWKKIEHSLSNRTVLNVKNTIDIRSEVKQALQPVMNQWNVRLTWSFHSQFIYYENEMYKQQFIQNMLERLIERQLPVSLITKNSELFDGDVSSTSKKGINLDALKKKVEQLQKLQLKLKQTENNVHLHYKQLQHLQTKKKQLHTELEQLTEERKELYAAFDDKNKELSALVEQKNLAYEQLNEFQETERFLAQGLTNFKKELKDVMDEEKKCKRKLDYTYEQLTNLKKSEATYMAIFKLVDQKFSLHQALRKHETRLQQYKQLKHKIETELQYVKSFFELNCEQQEQNMDKLYAIDKLFKLTNNIADIKQSIEVNNQRSKELGITINYTAMLQNDLQRINEKLIELKVVNLPSYVQPYFFRNDNLQVLRGELELLLENPVSSRGIFSKQKQREWLQQFEAKYLQYLAGCQYWFNQQASTNVQLQQIGKQLDTIMHQYAIQIHAELQKQLHLVEGNYIRNTEIDISKVYLELFQLNSKKEKLKSNVSYLSEIEDEKTFKNEKSIMQLQLTNIIADAQSLTAKKEALQKDISDFEEKMKQLEREMRQKSEGFESLKNAQAQLALIVGRLQEKYENSKQKAETKLLEIDKVTAQIEEIETQKNEQLHLSPSQQDIQYLPYLENVLQQQHVIPQNIDAVQSLTPDEIQIAKGIVIVENFQQLSLIQVQQLAQTAAYIVAFVPVVKDHLTDCTLIAVEKRKQLPLLAENNTYYDECSAQLLQLFFTMHSTMNEQVHYVSTEHIRNNEFITWLLLNEACTLQTIEMLFQQLQESNSRLIDEHVVARKMQVKVLLEDFDLHQQYTKKIQKYQSKYKQLHIIKQAECEPDLHIVYFTESDNSQQQLQLIKELLLTKKPFIILSIKQLLLKKELQEVVNVLSKFKRIRESSREKQWETSIKRKV